MEIKELEKKLIDGINAIEKERIKLGISKYDLWKNMIYSEKILDFTLVLETLGNKKCSNIIKKQKNYKKAFNKFKKIWKI